jgi:L-2,4-diaminobutyric acid acetyltransferase
VTTQQEETLRRATGDTVVHFRNPEVADAASIWSLVRDSGVLDLNSQYAYLLLCDHFAKTCLVAIADNQLAGFVAAYLPPNRPATVFVWQIGIAPTMRKQGLAKRLLQQLVRLPDCADARFLEATVTPSNRASHNLFAAFARDCSTELRMEPGYLATDFAANSSHEAEDLFRIGPLPSQF